MVRQGNLLSKFGGGSGDGQVSLPDTLYKEDSAL
jgi:hypothetical protein